MITREEMDALQPVMNAIGDDLSAAFQASFRKNLDAIKRTGASEDAVGRMLWAASLQPVMALCAMGLLPADDPDRVGADTGALLAEMLRDPAWQDWQKVKSN